MLRTEKRDCAYCSKEFNAPTRDVKRGRARFCSISCASRHTRSLRTIPPVNCTCATCGTSFYKTISKLAKSKHRIYFCSRTCKDVGQRIGGIRDIQPPHYGTALVSYRAKAFRELPNRCAHCGYADVLAVLEVNHKDCNHENNDLSNLEILCPTCHALFHFHSKTGRWSKRS